MIEVRIINLDGAVGRCYRIHAVSRPAQASCSVEQTGTSVAEPYSQCQRFPPLVRGADPGNASGFHT